MEIKELGPNEGGANLEARKEILKQICHFQRRVSMLAVTYPLEKDLWKKFSPPQLCQILNQLFWLPGSECKGAIQLNDN